MFPLCNQLERAQGKPNCATSNLLLLLLLLQDRLSAALGSSGSPSTLSITCMIFALLLVNGICYVFLLHVVYHVILSSMGFKMGPLPGIVRKYLYAGLQQQPAASKT